MRLLNVSIYRKVHHQIFPNKRHLTKDISKNTSRTLDFLSNVIEMKYKSKKLPKNRRSPEAIQVQLDMSHMRQNHTNSFKVGAHKKYLFTVVEQLNSCSLYNHIVCFIVDSSELHNSDDLLSDDISVWRNNRVDIIKIAINAQRVIKRIPKSITKTPSHNLKRVYRVHGTDKVPKRSYIYPTW